MEEEPRVAVTEVKVPQVEEELTAVAKEVKVPQVVVVVKVDQVVEGMEEEVKVVMVMAGVAWAVMLFSPMHLGVHHASMMSFRQYIFPAKLSLQ